MKSPSSHHGRPPARPWRSTLAGLVLCLGVGVPVAAQGSVESLPDLAHCRGVNWVVAGSHNPIDQWLDYDPLMVETNLATLDAFGVNALRVFGSYSVWEAQPVRYRLKLRDLATQVYAEEMLLMVVLFDSFGVDPTGNLAADADTRTWFRAPPRAEVLDPGAGERFHAYIEDTMWAVEEASRIAGGGQVIYDAWNEPDTGYVSFSVLVDVLASVKSIANRPTTVGFARVEENLALIENLPHPALLDIVSHHPYGIFEAVVQQEAAQAREYAGLGVETPRPILATEVVNHGAAQDCAHVLGWLEREGEGFFLWEAFASQTPFASIDGLFYADPSDSREVLVRDLEGVNKLLSMAVKQGFVPRKDARLKPPGSEGFIPYAPTPYGFTAPMAHDLLMNWDEKVGVYFPTVTSGHPAAMEFHRRLLTWAVLSLGKLGLITNEDRERIAGFQEDFQQALERGDMEGIERSFSGTANLIGPRVRPFAAPLNTPPEIVYMRQRLQPVGEPMASAPTLVQKLLTIEMLVNDADRLDDVVASELYLAAEGRLIFLGIPSQDGQQRGKYVFPVGEFGFPFTFLGGVLDRRGGFDLLRLDGTSVTH